MHCPSPSLEITHLHRVPNWNLQREDSPKLVGVGGGGTSSLVNSGALSLMSSMEMMAEAVAVRPSPDMSATCRVRLYTATTWGQCDMNSEDVIPKDNHFKKAAEPPTGLPLTGSAPASVCE